MYIWFNVFLLSLSILIDPSIFEADDAILVICACQVPSELNVIKKYGPWSWLLSVWLQRYIFFLNLAKSKLIQVVSWRPFCILGCNGLSTHVAPCQYRSYTVLVLIKLTKFAVALRLRCGSCKLIFLHYMCISSFFAKFKNVVHSLEPGETPSNSASHQAQNCVQRS